MAILSSLRLRFILALILVAVIPIGTIAFMIDRATEQAFRAYNTEQDTANAKALAAQVGSVVNVPITIVDSTGSVAYSQDVFSTAEVGAVSSGGISIPIDLDPQTSGVSSITTGNAYEFASVPNVQSGAVSANPSSGTTASTAFGSGGVQSADDQEGFTMSLPGIPDNAFLDRVNRGLWIALGFSGLSALLLAVLLARSVVRPVEQLTAAARGLSDGDLDRRVTVRSPHEIGVLASAFNTMAESRQRLDALRRNLVNDVAHELRTPLANLQGYLEVLRDGLTAPTPEVLAVLHEESLALNGLVADLQELALAEAGQLPLQREAVNLREPIAGALEALRPQADARELRLTTSIPDDLPTAFVDAARVSQILRNLLRNAVTHTPAGGAIDVRAEHHGAAIAIAVSDTGHGIAPEHLPHIFDRFYRADPARSRETGGSGLGLAVVKNLVEVQGGEVTVKSTLDAGSTFTFTLPIAR